MTRLPQQSRRAFTLIELLTVTVIIALLTALVLPALNSVRARARAATCLNNLHQLSSAITLYADDFEGTLPACNATFLSGHAGANLCWFHAIDFYVLKIIPTGAPTPVQQMALIKQDPIWSQFDVNARSNWRSFKLNRKLIGNKVQGSGMAATNAVPPWRKIHSISSPASTPSVFDGRCQDDRPGDPQITWYEGWEVYVALRHFGGANLSFVDGHSEWSNRGTPGAGGGWASDSTPWTWWVD